jgi:hypothetical protein
VAVNYGVINDMLMQRRKQRTGAYSSPGYFTLG